MGSSSGLVTIVVMTLFCYVAEFMHAAFDAIPIELWRNDCVIVASVTWPGGGGV